jgi:hypothetical protein
MALSGELSDLSLAELIEFFCNQRKTGRLKIAYDRAPGFFYFQNGALADAKIGVLRGVDAIYYALTLENAQFKFSPSFPPDERTINQPWAQVALEGLRRMDEGIAPIDAFPPDFNNNGSVTFGEDGEPIHLSEPADLVESTDDALAAVPVPVSVAPPKTDHVTAPLSMMVAQSSGGKRKFAMFAAVAAVLLITAAIGVPAGWYGKRKAAPVATNTLTQPDTATAVNTPDTTVSQTSDAAVPSTAAPAEVSVPDPAKANREKADRAKADEKAKTDKEKPAAATEAAAPVKPDVPKPGPKMVTVQVSYDENGRVTQASGADATATRIARQRRFPTGKPGVATVTIPLN